MNDWDRGYERGFAEGQLDIASKMNQQTVKPPTMSCGPISPEEARQQQAKKIPPVVFDAFNALLVARASSDIITIKQNELIAKVLVKDPSIARVDLFTKHWLDIEEAYRKAGWNVVYDKPAYSESYEANWQFTVATESER